MLDGISRLAKLLASNELKNRKLGYKYVCELMKLRPGTDEVEVSYIDILGICKGLYYSLWMQDKLLLQEDSVARIVKLISLTKNRSVRSMYVKGIFETLAREWENLDIWRQDKFMMLVRDFFVRCISSVKKRTLGSETVANAIFNSILNTDVNSAVDLKLHLIAVIKEELFKIDETPSIVNAFFKKALENIQKISTKSAYSTDMVTLLIFLAKQMCKYPGFPFGKISDQLLILSTKVSMHRKTFLRVAKILHSKKSRVGYNEQGNASEISSKHDSATSSEVTLKLSPSRKRKLSLQEPPTTSPERKRSKKEVSKDPENVKVFQKENTQESVLAPSEASTVSTSEPFKDSGSNIVESNLDLSVVDSFGGASPPKRVSFGKIFCKKFYSEKKLSAKFVPLLATPSRGILRH